MAAEGLLLTSLTAHYQKNKNHRQILYEINEGISPVSLRAIDWFVTHYAKLKSVLYWIPDSAGASWLKHAPPTSGASAEQYRKFNLYLEYRAQLKAYTKLYFDPFRRHERITFVLEQQPLRTIETTIGQLNFFRWALQQHVIDYISKHLSEIENHMALHNKKVKSTAASSSNAASSGAGASGHASVSAHKCSSNGNAGVLRAHCQLRFD